MIMNTLKCISTIDLISNNKYLKLNYLNMSNFTNDQVTQVSNFLQMHMQRNNIDSMTADECADLLAMNKILPNNIGPKPGFNFRQMLRDGRDKLIDLVEGAYQARPKTKWTIFKK